MINGIVFKFNTIESKPIAILGTSNKLWFNDIYSTLC